MTDPHLDDEQLSLHLDDPQEEAGSHLRAGCNSCGSRLAALSRVRSAVAAARVAPLTEPALDRLVENALRAAAPAADVVPLSAARSRLRSPPPAWLLGVAAALVALVGVAGLLRTGDGRSQSAGSDGATESRDEATTSEGATASATAGDAFAARTAGGDPEMVTVDLADQDDPAELAALLAGHSPGPPSPAALSATRQSSAADAAEGGAAAPTDAPQSPPSVDRALCRAEAERVFAGRVAALQSTATLRWKGEPAEVLVFSLADASGAEGVTRQALVLSRPGCALLADPRF